MKNTSVKFGPFLGPVTSLDPTEIPKNAAASAQDCRYEDGVLRSRYGYANVAAAQASTNAVRGLDYVAGYNSSYAAVNEFISFEKVSNKVHPWSVATSNYARTEIKNSATSVDLYDSAWRAVAFDQHAYMFNPDAAAATQLYRHTIGTATSLSAISTPVAPTTKPGYTILNPNWLELAGLNPASGTELAVTGLASNTNSTLSADNGTINVRHTAGSNVISSVEIILSETTTGKRDWYYNDAFSLTINEQSLGQLTVDPSSISVIITNDDTPAVPVSPVVVSKRDAWGNIKVRCWWDGGKVRSLWGNGSGTGKLAKIKVTYNITKGTHTGTATVNSEVHFLVDKIGYTRTLPETDQNSELELAYSYYDSTTDLESELSPTTTLSYSQLGLPMDSWYQYDAVGYRFYVTFPATGAVDKVRIYARDLAGNWRRVTTVDDTTSPYTYMISYDDLTALTTYTARSFETTRKITGAFPFKGWMVWLYKGGSTNIMHSGVGEPLRQQSDYDLEDDLTRGSSFSLADDFGDEPLWGHQCGDAAIITGSRGVYAQFGDRPSNMSPIVKLPGSFGVANQYASCRWRDDNGNPVVVFVDKNGDGAWLVYPQIDVSTVVELTVSIRSKMKAFLLTAQTLTSSSIRIGVDETRDALWIVCGKRAMVLRKASLADGKRQWEFYVYPFAVDVNAISYTIAQGMKVQKADGTIDEIERTNSTGAFITTDAGGAVPIGTWTAPTLHTPWLRIGKLHVDRTTVTEAISVSTTSDRLTTAANSILAHRSWCRCPAKQQGVDHVITISVPAGTGGIQSLTVEFFPCAERRYV
jgi:hypothetical protein